MGVEYNTFVRFYSDFSFPFLSFPSLFYSCHHLQPERLNRFTWLMAQNARLVQGGAFGMSELCQTILGGSIP